jgi:hypothetical protein
MGVCLEADEWLRFKAKSPDLNEREIDLPNVIG